MFLTVSDLMSRYQLSRGSVFNYVRQGRLPRGIYIGKSHRWKLTELEEWEKRKELSGHDN